MVLWKLLALLMILKVALSKEDLQVPLEIEIGDLINNLPNQEEKLKALFEKLSDAEDSSNNIAFLNDYAEDLLRELNKFIISNSMDPVPMPDIEEEFEWKVILITYRGLLSLTRGWLQGLGTFERRGNVFLEYHYPYINLTLPLGFKTLLFDYQYKTKFMGITTTGGVDGKVKESEWLLVLDLNMVTLRANLGKYKLKHLGNVSVKLNGNPWTDWMLNMFVSVTITFVKPVLRMVLGDFIGSGINTLLDYYNQLICRALGDCI